MSQHGYMQIIGRIPRHFGSKISINQVCQHSRGQGEQTECANGDLHLCRSYALQCIPNYPDRNLPTMIIYRNGELHRQIIGLRPEIGLDGMNTKCEGRSGLQDCVGIVAIMLILTSTFFRH